MLCFTHWLKSQNTFNSQVNTFDWKMICRNLPLLSLTRPVSCPQCMSNSCKDSNISFFSGFRKFMSNDYNYWQTILTIRTPEEFVPAGQRWLKAQRWDVALNEALTPGHHYDYDHYDHYDDDHYQYEPPTPGDCHHYNSTFHHNHNHYCDHYHHYRAKTWWFSILS